MIVKINNQIIEYKKQLFIDKLNFKEQAMKPIIELQKQMEEVKKENLYLMKNKD